MTSKRIKYSLRSSNTGSKYGEPGDKMTVGGTTRSGMNDDTFRPRAVKAKAYSARLAVISFTAIRLRNHPRKAGLADRQRS